MARGKTDRVRRIGNMGAPMVRCLVKAGHSVLADDLRPEPVQALVASAAGIEAASNSAAVASRCRVVITMLPETATCAPPSRCWSRLACPRVRS